MSRLRVFLDFLYDFVVGDDPVIAVVIVFALAGTAVVAGSGAAAWWMMPTAALAALTFSVLRASPRVDPRADRGVDGVSGAANRRHVRD
jgi:hypothetical protein